MLRRAHPFSQQVHFIFRYKSPKTGEFEEKHLKVPPRPSIEKLTNLYTLVIQYVEPLFLFDRRSQRHYSPNNTYEVFINGESEKKGSLLEDFEPPVNPAQEIDDPEDKKPADWVEEATIPDPDATKVSSLRSYEYVGLFSHSPMIGTRKLLMRSLTKTLKSQKAGLMTNLPRFPTPVRCH